MRKINYFLLAIACLLGTVSIAHAETFQSTDNGIASSSLRKVRLAPAAINRIDEHEMAGRVGLVENEDNEEVEESEESEDEEESDVNEVEDAFSDGYEQGFATGFDRGFEMGLQKAAEKGLFKHSGRSQRFSSDFEQDGKTIGKRPPRIRDRKSNEPCFYEEANAGIAKRLNGKTHVLTVFISEDKWESEDKKKYVPNLEKAEDWIKKQAEKYNSTKVEFKNSFVGLDTQIVINGIHNGTGSSKDHYDLGTKVFNALGYKTMQEYEKSVREENSDCQNFLVIFCANKNGSGYSQPCYFGADKGKFLDWAVLYTKYIDGKFEDFTPQNIAHEILHIFGAWDLYQSYDHSKEQAQYAKEHFPNDIMRETYKDFDKLEIGPLTAWRVGLTDTKEDWYYFFEPDFYKSR